MMATTQPFTTLRDRVLWHDGSVSFTPDSLFHALKVGPVRHVTEMTGDIIEYNNLMPTADAITVKTECGAVTPTWILPEEWQQLDVLDYVSEQHQKLIADQHIEGHEQFKRESRLAQELQVYQSKGLFDILRTVIYVINMLDKHNVVWGVGRGSSVSSYVLFVIGTHDVDSFEYNLDFSDFLN